LLWKRPFLASPDMIRIEVQDQFGQWHRYTKVSNTPTSIKFGMQTALKTQLASKSKKVRAVDDKTGALVDMLQG
jgi:hypothetical protein